MVNLILPQEAELSTSEVAEQWQVLTDFERYGEWNPFCIGCSTTLEPGTPIIMRERLASKFGGGRGRESRRQR